MEKLSPAQEKLVDYLNSSRSYIEIVPNHKGQRYYFLRKWESPKDIKDITNLSNVVFALQKKSVLVTTIDAQAKKIPGQAFPKPGYKRLELSKDSRYAQG